MYQALYRKYRSQNFSQLVGQDVTLTKEAINKTNYTGNDEGAERIAPVFTAACTTTEILVLKSNGFFEILEDTFFLHESFTCLRVDKCDYDVRKGR